MLSYIHYTDNLPTNVGGSAKGPFIRIKHKYKDDKGIHAHEETHVNQWWAWVALGAITAAALYSQGYIDPAIYALGAGLSAHGLLYTFIKPYKLFCEVQAFKAQLPHYPEDRTDQFAEFIASPHYDVNVSVAEAKQMLLK